MNPSEKSNGLGIIIWMFPALLALFGVIFSPFGFQTLGFGLLLIISLRNVFSNLFLKETR